MRFIKSLTTTGLIAATALGASVALTSCDGKDMATAHKADAQASANAIFANSPNSESISFLSFEDTIYIELPSMTELVGKPSYATMGTSGVFPVSWGKVNLKPLQNRLTQLAFGTENVNLNEAIEYYALHPALVEDSSKVMMAPPTLLNDSTMSEQQSIISVTAMNADMLSMSVFSYTYPYGAAHGNYGTTYVNFYLPTAQVLDKSNVFIADKSEQLILAIRQAARNQYASAGSMVDPSEINSYENFYITPSAVTFVYAPYEIAPYAAGEVSIELEPNEVYDFLTPLGKEVLGF